MENTPKLKRVVRFDSLPTVETNYTEEGFLIDHPIVTTVGIFEYMNPDGTIRRELRLPEEVFAHESLVSYKGKPIIVTHDAGRITKENVEQETIGTILSDGYKDGDNVRAEIVIHDTDKMKQSGLRELSLGYNLDLDETPGEWNGHHYDAIQRNIRVNHLALVAAARAGEQARLNIDGKEILTGGPVMENTKTDSGLSPEELQAAIDEFLKKKNAQEPAVTDGEIPDTEEPQNVADEDIVPVDDESKVDEEEDVVQSVKDRRDRRDAEEASKSPDTALEVINQQDADIDALLKLIEQLRAQSDFASANTDGNSCNNDENESNSDCNAQKTDSDDSKSQNLNLDSAAIDRIVAEKLDVIRTADRLNLDGVEGMTIINAKKTVIKKVMPEMRLDGKSVDYINALYDLTKNKVAKESGTNAQRKQMFNKDAAKSVAQAKTLADEAREKMISKQTRKEGGNK